MCATGHGARGNRVACHNVTRHRAEMTFFPAGHTNVRSLSTRTVHNGGYGTMRYMVIGWLRNAPDNRTYTPTQMGGGFRVSTRARVASIASVSDVPYLPRFRSFARFSGCVIPRYTGRVYRATRGRLGVFPVKPHDTRGGRRGRPTHTAGSIDHHAPQRSLGYRLHRAPRTTANARTTCRVFAVARIGRRAP